MARGHLEIVVLPVKGRQQDGQGSSSSRPCVAFWMVDDVKSVVVVVEVVVNASSHQHV